MVNRLDDSRLKSYEKQLRLELQETEQQLLSLQPQGASNQAVATPNGEWLDGLIIPTSAEASALVERYQRLDASLCQIELGLFGVCSDCEDPIELDRLEKDLTTQRCAKCEERHSKHPGRSRVWL